MLQLCVHFLLHFIVVKYFFVLAPVSNFGNFVKQIFVLASLGILSFVLFCVCTFSPCYLFVLCVPFLSFVLCASCPFICPVRCLVFYLPCKFFPLSCVLFVSFTLCPYICIFFPVACPVCPYPFICRMFPLSFYLLGVFLAFYFPPCVLCPFICPFCHFLCIYTLCSLSFALCVHSLHLPYVLCSFPCIYTVCSLSFCFPCVSFSLPIHFLFALCVSAPSIQVNGTMRYKSGYHHHHVSFVLTRRRPVRGQCVPTDLFREQRRQVVHL